MIWIIESNARTFVSVAHSYSINCVDMSIPKHASRSDVLWSRRQIEGLIADGRSIIIIDHRVLKVDAWMKYHPGGDKSIMHMVGKDATDEVNA